MRVLNFIRPNQAHATRFGKDMTLTEAINDVEAYRREYGPLEWLDQMRSHCVDSIRDAMQKHKLPCHSAQDLIESLNCLGEFEANWDAAYWPDSIRCVVSSGSNSVHAQVEATLSRVIRDKRDKTKRRVFYRVEEVT